MPGKKRSKVNTLRAFLTPQTGIFDQKHRRCVNCQQTLSRYRVFCLPFRVSLFEAVGFFKRPDREEPAV